MVLKTLSRFKKPKKPQINLSLKRVGGVAQGVGPEFKSQY
jgi:hypothetical protein